MTDKILRTLTAIRELRSLWRRVPIGSVASRTRYVVRRQFHYAYIVFAAMSLIVVRAPGKFAVQ